MFHLQLNITNMFLLLLFLPIRGIRFYRQLLLIQTTLVNWYLQQNKVEAVVTSSKDNTVLDY